jgi:SAM-dependent methyltransferase
MYAPRSIKEWKKSPFPRHELLGAKNVFSTDDQPSWRNVLFFKHVPWIHEHKVAGNAVFPAAGYIALAIEAARQVSAGDAGYQIQNLQLSHAMVLDRYNTVEIITSLRRCGGWYDFNISSHNGESWVEHCSGRVRRGSSFSSRRRGARGSASKGPLEGNSSSDLSRSIDPAKWYQTLAKTGVDYGASFQGVRSLRSSSSRLYSSATVVSTVKETVYYPIHPTKLDACFQGVYAAAYQGLEWKIGQLPVPTRFGEINILDCASDITCNVSAHSLRRGAIGASAEAYAADGTIMMTLEDTIIQPLGVMTVESNRGSGARLHWGQAVDFVPLSSLVSSPPGSTENAMILDLLTKACIEENLSRLERQGVTASVSHLAKYHDWLRAHRGADCSGLVLKDVAQQASTTSIGACAAAMVRVVDNIVPLCKGEVDPVELLLSDDTLLEMYNYLNMVDRAPLFKTLGHHHPGQRILEIGAGTGGTTAKIIGETRYSTYTFTDISAAFFPAARSRFEAYPNIIFKTLDITKDPLSQGFLPESFDLIIASNVLHATPSLHETLVHVRRLLHPYGKLLLEELCGDIKYSNIVTGVLSGWWAGEDDGRAEEPYVSPERWDMEMRAAGFNGLDGLAFDAAPPLHSMAYMLASPNTERHRKDRRGTHKPAVLVADSRCSETAIIFQKQLCSRGYEVTVQDLGQSLACSSHIIVLVDTASPFFHDISASNLSRFQQFLRELQRSHSGALWVTRSSQVGCKDPHHSLAIGVARTSRTEFGVDLATCELDTIDYATAALTLDVFEQFGRRFETETYLREMEYVIHKNSVLVGRMLPFSMQEEVENAVCLTFDRSHSRIVFDVDMAKWVVDALQPTLAPNEVEIDVHTAGVSYRVCLLSFHPFAPYVTG